MKVESVSLQSYLVGFFLSLAVTLVAYFMVAEKWLSGSTVLFAIGGLAALQAVIQLLYFFHLGKESSPPWKLFVFLFMLMIAAIVIILTIWIMYNLDYRMMPKM